MFRGKERGGKRKGEEREKDGRKRDGGTSERETECGAIHPYTIVGSPPQYNTKQIPSSEQARVLCTFTTVHTTRTTHIHTQPPKSQGIDSFSMCMKTATK